MNEETRRKNRLRSKLWGEKNKERVRKNFARWYALNRDRVKKQAAEWKKANPERYAANQAAWRKRVSDRRCAQASSRKAEILRAKPKWANDFFISEAYHLAKLRTEMLGFPWHVDHIVPLKSDLVCGLHVEHNLQVIPGSENLKKQNLYWPDMPMEQTAWMA